MKILSTYIILPILTAFVLMMASGCGQNEETDTHDHGSHSMMEENTEGSAHSDGHDAHMGDHHEAGAHMEEQPTDARAVTVTATDFTFDPVNITAKPGEKLFITLVNKGNAVHMWQLEGRPETHLHTPIGETAAKTVIAPTEPGTYQVICSTPGHVQLGMVGQLVVKGESDNHGAHAH